MEEQYAKLSQQEMDAAHGRLEVISYCTLAEINHFNQYRVGDFKLIMQQYLQKQIDFHENVRQANQPTIINEVMGWVLGCWWSSFDFILPSVFFRLLVN